MGSTNERELKFLRRGQRDFPQQPE